MENNMISSLPVSRNAEMLPISDEKKSYKLEFIMECNPNNAGHPALGATGITVIGLKGINGDTLSLDRVSPMKWTYIRTMTLPMIADNLMIIPQSKEGWGSDSIYWIGTKHQGFGTHQDSDLDIEALDQTGNTANNLSQTLSFKICVFSPEDKASQEASQNMFFQTVFEIVTKENPGALFDLTCKLPTDLKEKPDLLKLCGDYFQACFDDVESLSEFENAIQAYNLAIALLPIDDDRLIEYKCDAGALLLLCYDLTGNMENINLAISMIEMVVKKVSDQDQRIVGCLGKLGSALNLCAAKADNIEKLPVAIAMHKKAINLNLIPESHEIIMGWLDNLAQLLDSQFEKTSNLSDLSELILVEQKVVNLTPKGHEAMPARLYNLGNSLQLSFERTGYFTDLAEAISAQQKAVNLTPEGYADMPMYLNNLGIAFQCRFGRTGDIEDLAEAISAYQKAINLTPEDDADMPSYLSNLGNSFQSCFESTGDLKNLAEAISAYQKAVNLIPEGHAAMPSFLSNLGGSFESRFRRTGGIADLAEAISALQKAVNLTPEGHVNMPGLLNNLGNTLETCFGETGDIADLAEAISARQKAINLTPEGHVDMPTWLSNLGSSFQSRFERIGDLTDLLEAKSAYQKAVNLTPEGHVDMPKWLSNLGISLESHFDRTGNIADLAEAISAQQKAVNLTPEGHVNMPMYLNNLGTSFESRFERTENLTDNAEAISAKQKAVNLTPEGHTNMPLFLNNLGNSFQSRFERIGNLTDLAEAISAKRRAVNLTPEGHVNMPGWLSNLGNSLESRFRRTGDLTDLTEAISAKQRAVNLTPENHAFMPARLNNLGISLDSHFGRTADLTDISEAISAQQKSVNLTPEGHVDMPSGLNNLGNLFQCRFERIGDLTDLLEAISAYQKAVNLTPEGHAGMPKWLSNLGGSFESRFERTGNLTDLSEAISAQQKAVNLTPEGHTGMPLRLNSLAISLKSRFERTADLTDISEAISAQQKAVNLTPEGHADMPTWLSNLGSSFQSRFERIGDLTDLFEAISAYQKAVNLTPEGHADMPSLLNNLANSFESSFERTGDLKDLAEAIFTQQKAVNLTPEGHADMSIWLINLGRVFKTCFAHTNNLSDIHMAISNYHQAATQAVGPPSICLEAALSWATLSEKFHTSDVINAYNTAISLISQVAGLEQTIQTRLNNLIKWSNLSISAATVALSYKEVEKALEWFEQSRCLIWNQISNLHTPLDDLKVYDPALADSFFKLSKALHNSGTRTEFQIIDINKTMKEKMSLQDEALAHIKISQDWHRGLAKIHQIPSFKNFLQPLQASELLSHLPIAGPVIIINVHKTHSDALVLISRINTPYHIPLERFSYQQAFELQQDMHSYLSLHNVRLQDSKSETRGMRYKQDANIIYKILEQLWSNVVKPILDHLRILCPSLKFSRIWWCTTGPLTFLPIHAAGIYRPGNSISEDCLSNFAVSSYTPSVSALIERTRNIHKTNCISSRILLVNPNAPGLPFIPGTKIEVEGISKLTNGKLSVLCLQEGNATLSHVKQKMTSYNWIHFACHATQAVNSPLQSGLHLQDGKLELSEIIKTKIDNANFAFLSACQTSTGDEELTEEAIHLAAGMLAAGYQGVVATMWSIMDQYASEIAQDFYHILLNDKTLGEKYGLDSSEAAYALHKAIQHFLKNYKYSEEALRASLPYVHFGL